VTFKFYAVHHLTVLTLTRPTTQCNLRANSKRKMSREGKWFDACGWQEF